MRAVDSESIYLPSPGQDPIQPGKVEDNLPTHTLDEAYFNDTMSSGGSESKSGFKNASGHPKLPDSAGSKDSRLQPETPQNKYLLNLVETGFFEAMVDVMEEQIRQQDSDRKNNVAMVNNILAAGKDNADAVYDSQMAEAHKASAAAAAGLGQAISSGHALYQMGSARSSIEKDFAQEGPKGNTEYKNLQQKIDKIEKSPEYEAAKKKGVASGSKEDASSNPELDKFNEDLAKYKAEQGRLVDSAVDRMIRQIEQGSQLKGGIIQAGEKTFEATQNATAAVANSRASMASTLKEVYSHLQQLATSDAQKARDQNEAVVRALQQFFSSLTQVFNPHNSR